jgi:hypothetical protein
MLPPAWTTRGGSRTRAHRRAEARRPARAAPRARASHRPRPEPSQPRADAPPRAGLAARDPLAYDAGSVAAGTPVRARPCPSSVGASARASANSESSKGAAICDPPASPRFCRLPSMSIDPSGVSAHPGASRRRVVRVDAFFRGARSPILGRRHRQVHRPPASEGRGRRDREPRGGGIAHSTAGRHGPGRARRAEWSGITSFLPPTSTRGRQEAGGHNPGHNLPYRGCPPHCK